MLGLLVVMASMTWQAIFLEATAGMSHIQAASIVVMHAFTCQALVDFDSCRDHAGNFPDECMRMVQLGVVSKLA